MGKNLIIFNRMKESNQNVCKEKRAKNDNNQKLNMFSVYGVFVRFSMFNVIIHVKAEVFLSKK